jgi:hypothetical protein
VLGSSLLSLLVLFHSAQFVDPHACGYRRCAAP